MPDKSVNDNIPPGFTLRHILREDTERITGIAWSPDGKVLAAGSDDMKVYLWDMQKGQFPHILTGHSDVVLCVDWSPDARVLASGSNDETIRLWDIQTGQLLQTLTGHSDNILCI